MDDFICTKMKKRKICLCVFLLLFCALTAFTQSIQITGTVTDSENQPIIGAGVTVKGTTTGTVTGVDGKYTVTVPNDNAVLSFSYIGFTSQEVAVENRRTIDIVLLENLLQIEEVIVVGYGVQKKETLTGSVVNITGSEIVKSPSANVTNSLAGKLPGLIVNQRSGRPGDDDPTIWVRGQASFAGDNANRPLIIIDGVERDNMSRINPEDVESISVLKDASAAIYGARAANGVILVTTKRGAIGKPVFNFIYNTSFSHPTTVPDMLDAAEFAVAFNEAAWYRANRPANWSPYYTEEVIQKYRNGSEPILYPNTNWVKEVMLPYSMQNRASLQVTGGSDAVQYLLSFGVQNQGSEYRNMPAEYTQYNLRTNVNVQLNKYLSVGANISAIISDRTESSVNTNDDFTNIIKANPTLVARYPNGLIAPGRLGENPLLLDQRGYRKTSNTPFYSTFNASLIIPWITGLKVDASFNYDLRNQFAKLWKIPYYYHEYNVVTGEYDLKQGTGQTTAELTDTYSKWTTLMYNVRLSYNTTIGQNHNINVMVGTEKQKNNDSNANAYRRNFLSTLLPEINVGSTSTVDMNNGGSSGHSARDNYFGRFNYNFSSKYLVELMFRYDGSSNFAEGKRFGFFPAGSVGWRISEESFMKNSLTFVDDLKLRFSMGQTGNDRINAYQHFQTYSFTGNYVFGSTNQSGIRAGTIANPDVTWEVSTKTDIGLETTLWKGLLGLDVTLFKELRTNILTARNLSIPNTLGISSLPAENIGEAESKGYEIVLSHRKRVNKFNYRISANMSYNISKIIFMDETPQSQPYQERTGRPIGSQLLYKTDGSIFRTQEELDAGPRHNSHRIGDLKIIDMNGDGVINSQDQYRFDYTSTPRTVFGLNAYVAYKDFDLSLFFQGQAGAYNYDDQFVTIGGADFSNAYVARAKDRWSIDNPNGSMPRADAYQPGNTLFFMYDATFIRLKTTELGYTIPKNLSSKVRINDFRIYLSGFNLITWAKKLKWSDPEMSGRSLYYPQMRLMNIGVNIKF